MFVFLLMACLYLILVQISSAYADDIIIFITNQEDINRLGKIVDTFGKISAAKVNWAKSEALAVGRWSAGLPGNWKRGGG